MKTLYYKSGSLLFRELYIIWKFSNTYIFDTILLIITTSLAAWFYNEKSWNTFIPALLWSIIYAFSYIIVFATANQLNSIEEDKFNKPYRLLPSGELTQKQVYNRMVVYSIIYLVISLYFGMLLIGISWLAVVCLHERFNLNRHWFSKNHIIMPLGAIVLHVSAWYIISPLTSKVWIFYILLSAWCGLCMNLQDFRDQEGDKNIGRKTLPVALGDTKARWYQCLIMIVASPLLYGGLILSQTGISAGFTSPFVIVVLIIQTILNWFIAFRLLKYRTPKQDNITYHCWVIFYWFTIPLICFLK
ncbi:UbiA family prenyltransferase [Chryseobacterium wanjuense]